MTGASRSRRLHRDVGAVRVVCPHDSAERAAVNGTSLSLRRRLRYGRGKTHAVVNLGTLNRLCFPDISKHRFSAQPVSDVSAQPIFDISANVYRASAASFWSFGREIKWF